MLQRTVSSVSSMNRGTAPTESNLNTGRASTGERLRGGGGGGDLDNVSDTSSAREREFDALLGPEPDYAFNARRPATSRKHRLHEIGVAAVAAREERLKLERDRSLMKEMAQLTQRPNITKHARERAPKRELFYDHAEKWLERKTITRERLAQEQEERDLSEVFGSPAISQKSRDLTENPNRQYIHPVEDWELRFSEYLAKKQFDEIEPEHIPNTSKSMHSTARSFNLDDSQGDSVEAGRRLYEESITRHERREALLKTLVDQELTDPVTGKRYFTPYVSEHARKIGKHRDPTAAGDDLHRQASEFQRRRRELHERLASAETGCTFTPSINPMSAAVCKDSRKPLFDPTWKKDRHTPRDEKKDEKKLNVQAFLRRNHDGWIQTKESKLKEIRDTMKRDAMEECTFRPRISKRSQDLFLSQNSSGLPSSYKSSPPRMVAASQLDPVFSQSGRGFSNTNNSNRRNGRQQQQQHGATPSSQNLSGFTPSTGGRNQQHNSAAADHEDDDHEQLPSTTDVLNKVFQKPNYNDLTSGGARNNNDSSAPQSEAEREFQEAADNALRAAGLRSDAQSTATTSRSSRPSNFVPASSTHSSPSSAGRRTNTTATTSNTNTTGFTTSNACQRTPTAASSQRYTNVTDTTTANSSSAVPSSHHHQYNQQQQQPSAKNSLPPSVASQMRSSMGGNTSASHHTTNTTGRESSAGVPPSSSYHATSATARDDEQQQQYQHQQGQPQDEEEHYSTTTPGGASSSRRGTPTATATSYNNTNTNMSSMNQQQQQPQPSATSGGRRTPTPTATATATATNPTGTATNLTPSQQQQQQSGEQAGALQNQMYSLLNEWQQLENV